MRVFISYASSDEELARRVAQFLARSGLDVWDGTQILPGENWAAETAKALEQSDAMVVLLTPASLHSRQVSLDVSYALGQKDYSGRLVPVLAVPAEQISSEEIPWILNRLPMIRLAEYDREEEGLNKITEALTAGNGKPF